MKYTVINMSTNEAWTFTTPIEAFEKVNEVKDTNPNGKVKIEVE